MDLNLQKFLDTISGKFYHGTRAKDAIMREGFQPSKQGNLGPGVYATPDLDTAEGYAGGFRGGRESLRAKPGVLKGRVPYGTELFDLVKGNYTDSLKGHTSFEKFTDELKRQGYDGVKQYGRRFKEILMFDPGIANQTFGTKGPRTMPKAPKTAVGSAVFDLIGKPLVEGMLKTIGKPGQSNMSQLGIKPRSN